MPSLAGPRPSPKLSPPPARRGCRTWPTCFKTGARNYSSRCACLSRVAKPRSWRGCGTGGPDWQSGLRHLEVSRPRAVCGTGGPDWQSGLRHLGVSRPRAVCGTGGPDWQSGLRHPRGQLLERMFLNGLHCADTHTYFLAYCLPGFSPETAVYEKAPAPVVDVSRRPQTLATSQRSGPVILRIRISLVG